MAALPLLPLALIAGALLLTSDKKKTAVGEPVVTAGVDVELCIDQAAQTLGLYLAQPGIAVEPALFEANGFIRTARALRQGLSLENPLRLDIQESGGTELLGFAEEVGAASVDEAGSCINDELCFAADCLFAVASTRMAAVGRDVPVEAQQRL